MMVWSLLFLYSFSIINVSVEMKVMSMMTVIMISKSFSPNSAMTEMDFFFLDRLSMNMAYLSLIITVISMIIFVKLNEVNKSNLCFISGIIALTFFYSNNLIFFFILFECSLIPLLILILGWGKQPERMMAGQYIMFYTLFSSFPTLLIFISFQKILGLPWVTFMFLNSNYSLTLLNVNGMNSILCLSFMIAFLMKIPIFFFHSWLCKAHVEAPLEGSIILAGIMLKVGTYGVLRMEVLFHSDFMSLKFLILSISILGSILSLMMAISSDDLKLSIALSSVSHMNFLLCSMMTLKEMTVKCSTLIMISHGFISSILFFIVTLIYMINNSRSLTMTKGSSNDLPPLILFSLIFFSLSVSIPPSLSFSGEMISIGLVWSYENYLAYMICMFIIMNSFFSITLFGMLNHSSKKKKKTNTHFCLLVFLMLSSLSLYVMILTFFFPEMIL